MTNIFEEADRLRNQGQSLAAAKEYLKVAEASDSKTNQATCYHMAATSLKESKHYEDSTNYFNQAAEIYQLLNDQFNLARVLRDFADQLFDQEKYEEANTKFAESEEMLKNRDPGELAMTQIKLAVSLNQLDKVEDSNKKLFAGLKNVKKSSNPFYLATAYTNAAKIYAKRDEHSSAVDCLSGALGALQLDSDPHNKRHAEILLALAKSFKEIGNDDLTSKAEEEASRHLGELDEETADKVKSSI